MVRFAFCLLLLAAPALAQDAAPAAAPVAPTTESGDPRAWLEEVEGERPLEWARAQNAQTTAAVGGDQLTDLQERLLAVYDSSDRIPWVEQRGDRLYNFWRDAEHPRGLWRRTTLDSYRTATPDWEPVLDLDALGATEGVSWVWDGAQCLPPAYRRCLLSLSRGGADAVVVREFDAVDKAFVDGGFELPEAKQWVSWIDADSLWVSSDFGEGSQTDSGYPRTVRRWRRGAPLAEAPTAFEGDKADVGVGISHDFRPGYERDIASRSVTFFTNEVYLMGRKGPQKIDKPDDANATLWRDWLLLELRTDWTEGGTTWKSGSLLAAPLKPYLKNKRRLQVLFEPSDVTSLVSVVPLADHVLINTLDTVRSRVEVLTPGRKAWTREPIPAADQLDRVSVQAVDPDHSNAFWLTITGFTTPSTLALSSVDGAPETLKQLPAFFDASQLEVSQHMAASADGTQVPYFQVAPKDLPLDGSHATLLYGYGGFEVSLLPSYSATRGIGWLEQGGVLLVANIRGGGEFGPRWHQGALKEKRHRAYEDFAAIADDVVARGVTTPARLGALGGSNGGLLMGNMYTLYPQKFGAIVCAVPLLDMRRYSKLLAGASWMGEYGDPDDPAQWEYIQTFSPYHNFDAGRTHPPMLITTSTRDDRVHPGHARKMTALVQEAGKDVLYYENIEGGHGGAADNKQAAWLSALQYAFLWQRLTGPPQALDGTDAEGPAGAEAAP